MPCCSPSSKLLFSILVLVDELLDMVDVFFVKVLHEMLFYDFLDLLWLWYTSFLIVMYKLDLLIFHVQSFCCFDHSGVIFPAFYTSPTRSSALFSLGSLTFNVDFHFFSCKFVLAEKIWFYSFWFISWSISGS